MLHHIWARNKPQDMFVSGGPKIESNHVLCRSDPIEGFVHFLRYVLHNPNSHKYHECNIKLQGKSCNYTRQIASEKTHPRVKKEIENAINSLNCSN